MVASLSLFFLYKSNTESVMINCRSDFDSYVGVKKLHAHVELYLKNGKGSAMIVGDYRNESGVDTPMKLLTEFNYRAYGNLFHIRVRAQQSTVKYSSGANQFNYLLPLILNSKNIEYVYEFLPQGEGDYLIKQNGTPLFYCKKV
jgi:hypothetical protein